MQKLGGNSAGAPLHLLWPSLLAVVPSQHSFPVQCYFHAFKQMFVRLEKWNSPFACSLPKLQPCTSCSLPSTATYLQPPTSGHFKLHKQSNCKTKLMASGFTKLLLPSTHTYFVSAPFLRRYSFLEVSETAFWMTHSSSPN